MGNRAIDFDQAHRQLNEFFQHCKHRSQQDTGTVAVKDEKPLLKDEKLQIKDEKPWTKDEKVDVEFAPAAPSTQVHVSIPCSCALNIVRCHRAQ